MSIASLAKLLPLVKQLVPIVKAAWPIILAILAVFHDGTPDASTGAVLGTIAVSHTLGRPNVRGFLARLLGRAGKPTRPRAV
ncbi:hypothetical protein [Paludisphaera mucosa]|uniref:Uncharacterized protein n=1 Tax=Paludisphaera mucosa TaxID=3030827 RepID=A0ABT6F6K4_9BACT|nr:hypothetical protein [Paludisphaera mucosa]MDG3003228.1 hypothetical protein [Paludisphaera mucosa]